MNKYFCPSKSKRFNEILMILQRPFKKTAVKSMIEETEVDMMFTAICFVLFLMVFFKLLGIAIKVGWGLLKVALYLVVFPTVVLAMIFGGFVFIALPIILIAGATGMAVGA